MILRDFGLVSRDEIRRGSLSRADAPHLLDTLEGFLRSLVPLDARAVVIVDEAQSLSPEALDQVRMLGAYEEGGEWLLQIVLCGQPGLLNTLKTDPLRALNERITRRAGLSPLLAPEVEGYVRHRLSIAGAEASAVFAPEALGLVAEYSRGLPRRINVLCDRALDEGRHAESPLITAETVKRAAKSLASPSSAVPPVKAVEATAASAATVGEANPPRTAAALLARARRVWPCHPRSSRRRHHPSRSSPHRNLFACRCTNPSSGERRLGRRVAHPRCSWAPVPFWSQVPWPGDITCGRSSPSHPGCPTCRRPIWRLARQPLRHRRRPTSNSRNGSTAGRLTAAAVQAARAARPRGLARTPTQSRPGRPTRRRASVRASPVQAGPAWSPARSAVSARASDRTASPTGRMC